MPHYLQQVAYSQEGWAALVANPQNRIEAVRPAIEKLGGKIEAAWFSFGDYDVIVITELPDNVSAAAIAMAFAAGGACKSVQTTPLISPEEAMQALRKAKESGYRPASGRA
ncbi:MAG TPA: GYD domain-containing protein [Dongiaceae bacterium]|nr:GYD domain-containing protein [Dongiaceae bacterium]